MYSGVYDKLIPCRLCVQLIPWRLCVLSSFLVDSVWSFPLAKRAAIHHNKKGCRLTVSKCLALLAPFDRDGCLLKAHESNEKAS